MSAEEQKVDTVGADRFERDAPVMIYFKTNPPRSPEGCSTFCHLSRASNRQTRRLRSCAIPSRLFDLNGETDRVRKRKKSAIIAVDVRRFGQVIKKDEVFGTHRR